MRIFNFLLTFFVVYFSIPVVLILVSWNALPGQKLYRVKTSLEDLVLILTAKTPLASRLSISFTERRFGEASRLLASEGSVVGFELLVEEAKASKDIIVKKEDAVQAEILVEKIEKFQEEIEQKKETVQASNPTQGSILTPTSVAREDIVVPTPNDFQKPIEVKKEALSAAPQEVVLTLQQTQVKLEEIKKEIKREIPEIGKKQQEKVDRVEEGREGKDDRGDKGNSGKSEKSREQDKNKE